MAFGVEAGNGSVTKYVTKATKPGITWLAQPDASSLTFEAEGALVQQLTVTSATLPDGSPLPDGQPGYTTAVTMKHGSLRTYGGTTYYAAGSEDFRAYIWKIPQAGQLKEQRRPMTTEEWLSGQSGEGKGVFAYTPNRTSTYTLAFDDSPLAGHSSIINTALFHPTLPLLATSGIERFIRLHRPFHAPVSSSSEEHWTEEYPRTRNPPGRPGAGLEDAEAEAGTLADRLALEESWDPLDGPTISVFDRIIEAEGDLDIFDKWSGQRVTESYGEDGDGSSGSSSENEQDSGDEETEMDI
ncbi:hypothetical protein FRC04_002196 [Tulasnella sp. 424]|nr:hypothetical protein FRC04_002196 [Tulasnella sp. 424]